MKKLTAELLQEIKTSAQNATSGQWRRTSTRFNGITNTPLSYFGLESVLANAAEKRDAIFIATVNPQAVLLMVEALEIALPILEQQEQESRCQQCGGTGWAGGNRPWGEPVTVECDCQFEQQESQKEVSHE